MTHEVFYNGQIHEFPDEATPEMIAKALGVKPPTTSMNNLQSNKKNNLFSIDDIGNKSLSDIDPATKQIPIGAKEEFLKLLNAIPGIGKYVPAPNEEPIPDIEGASTYRTLGKLVGGAPVMGAVAAPIIATGGALGLPALASEMLGLGGAAALTTKGDAVNRGVAGIENAILPGALGGVNRALPGLSQTVKTLFAKIDPKGLAYSIQKSHDILDKQASDLYDFVKEEAINRGVQKIKISPEIIDRAEDILSNTRKNQELIKSARSGNYDALHDLQSDLRTQGSKSLSSDLQSERKLGDEMLDTRDKINESIENHFKEYGQDDLAKILREARSKFKDVKDTYYSHPTIAKLVDPYLRIIPKKPLEAFTEESERTKKLYQKHPEIPQTIKLAEEKKLIEKKLKRLGLGALTYEGIRGASSDIRSLLGSGNNQY